MRLLLFSLLFAMSGCVKTYHRDIPHPLIVKEQDTPFIFKETYQTVGLSATQKKVVHESDFVEIESTEEFVFWAPAENLKMGEVSATDSGIDSGCETTGSQECTQNDSNDQQSETQ